MLPTHLSRWGFGVFLPVFLYRCGFLWPDDGGRWKLTISQLRENTIRQHRALLWNTPTTHSAEWKVSFFFVPLPILPRSVLIEEEPVMRCSQQHVRWVSEFVKPSWGEGKGKNARNPPINHAVGQRWRCRIMALQLSSVRAHLLLAVRMSQRYCLFLPLKTNFKPARAAYRFYWRCFKLQCSVCFQWSVVFWNQNFVPDLF